jgi:hypothetical protein
MACSLIASIFKATSVPTIVATTTATDEEKEERVFP